LQASECSSCEADPKLTSAFVCAGNVNCADDFEVKGNIMPIYRGTSGDDTLIGSDNDDELYGLQGNDLLDARFGFDVIDGGPGYDIVSYKFYSSRIELSLTTGVVAFPGNSTRVDRLFSIEGVYAGSASDFIIGDGGNNVIDADFASNRFQHGNDAVYGLAGDDFINGGWGFDYLDGGDGVDIVDYSFFLDSSGTLFDLVRQQVFFSSQYSNGGNTDTIINFEGVIGGGGGDTFRGNANPNYFFGGAGNDVIDGAAGIDTAYYSGNRAEYHVSANVNGTFSVRDRVADRDGDDALAQVERLQFADREFLMSTLNQVPFAGQLGTLAAFASAAYQSGKADRDALIEGGWIPIEVFGTSISVGPTGAGDGTGLNTYVYGIGAATAFTAVKQVGGTSAFDVVISYGGTDDLADTVNDITTQLTGRFSAYNQTLQAYNAVIRSAIQEHAAILRNVYVTGHSLGGAAAQEYLRLAESSDVNHWGVTFGSPGTSVSPFGAVNHQLLQIEHANDVIGDVLFHRGVQLDVRDDAQPLSRIDSHRLDNYRATAETLDDIAAAEWAPVLTAFDDTQHVVIIGTDGAARFEL
jgi:hypothetical protein